MPLVGIGKYSFLLVSCPSFTPSFGFHVRPSLLPKGKGWGKVEGERGICAMEGSGFKNMIGQCEGG